MAIRARRTRPHGETDCQSETSRWSGIRALPCSHRLIGQPQQGGSGRNMVRSMVRRTSLRSQLYRAARDLGNVQAAEKGPTSYAKRVARRRVYRTTNGVTRKLLREFGL